jgi:hypothetical protein
MNRVVGQQVRGRLAEHTTPAFRAAVVRVAPALGQAGLARLSEDVMELRNRADAWRRDRTYPRVLAIVRQRWNLEGRLQLPDKERSLLNVANMDEAAWRDERDGGRVVRLGGRAALAAFIEHPERFVDKTGELLPMEAAPQAEAGGFGRFAQLAGDALRSLGIGRVA